MWDAKQLRLLETQLQTSGNWISVCGGLFGFKFVGCVFCQWLAKFRPSPRCSHPISKTIPHEEDNIHSWYFNEEDHIHSFSLPLPSEDGVMRQQPRGVKMRESDSHVSLLEFDFQWSDIVVLCFHVFLGSDVLVWFGDSTTAYGDAYWYHMYIWLCIRRMISPRYVPRYIILCCGYLVRRQAWRFCVAGWLPLS